MSGNTEPRRIETWTCICDEGFERQAVAESAYDALAAENERLRADLATAVESATFAIDLADKYVDEAERAAKENAALREALENVVSGLRSRSDALLARRDAAGVPDTAYRLGMRASECRAAARRIEAVLAAPAAWTCRTCGVEDDQWEHTCHEVLERIEATLDKETD